MLNRTLEQYLHSFVHDKPALWFSFLSLAEWSYNTSTHSGTGLSPYEITYGKPPPALPQYIAGTSPVEAADSILITRQALHSKLQCRLLKAQTTMKIYEDRNRRDVQFQIGDWVYVRLRPYRQLSVRPHYSKLAKKFYGPYQITERVSPVAYRLQLSTDSKIHPVFHVSLLKLHHGTPPVTDDTLPPTHFHNHPIVEPLSFLDWKWDTDTDPPSRQVLVQWRGLAPKHTSWEDWNSLRAAYNLEDEVDFPGDGVDSNEGSRTQDTGQEPLTHSRPKRITRRPAQYQDYV